MTVTVFYIIIVIILIIGLVDTAFTKIPSLARLRWRMKHNKGAVVLIVIMVLCLGAAAFNAYLDRSSARNLSELSSNHTVTEEVNTGIVDSFVSEIPNYDLSDCYFYTQLSDFDKGLYQVYYDLAIHFDYPAYKRTLVMEDWKYNAEMDDFSKVFYAMLQDHPEFFYLESSGTSSRLNITGFSTAGMSHVDISLSLGDSRERQMIKRFEQAADEFIQGIDLSASDIDIELQIHDKLISLVSYDYPVLSVEGFSLAHTAYGALCDDGMGHRNAAVCDGYAKAFQYLLKRAGINSVVVSGTAGTLDGGYADEGAHAWNIVLLDGEWYEVDCCWDDLDLDGMGLNSKDIEYVHELPQYAAATHWFFNRTTEEMKMIQEVEDYTIIIPRTNGYLSFNPCRQAFHIREKEATDEGYEAFCYINNMIPVANGTRFGLGL